jgi:hypothetical protein
MFTALSSNCLFASARLPPLYLRLKFPRGKMKKLRTSVLFIAVPMFGMLALPAFGQAPTAQVDATIMKALGLDPNALQAVQKEHTQVLPGISFGH